MYLLVLFWSGLFWTLQVNDGMGCQPAHQVEANIQTHSSSGAIWGSVSSPIILAVSVDKDHGGSGQLAITDPDSTA